jgi:hypothetical protein
MRVGASSRQSGVKLILQSNGDLSFVGSSVESQSNQCPTTLCTAVTSGSSMRKRVFQEGKALRLAKRQVDTKRLRELLAARQKHNEKKRR